ncbi:MAG: AMP-binding protein, partial [Thermomicrobiales bacterium]
MTDDSLRTAEHLTWDRLVADSCDRHGEAIALESDDGDLLTYTDLGAAITTIRRRLRELGIGREDRVGIVIDQTLSDAVLLTSVMAAATAVPLRPGTARDEYDAILPRLRLRAIILPTGLD